MPNSPAPTEALVKKKLNSWETACSSESAGAYAMLREQAKHFVKPYGWQVPEDRAEAAPPTRSNHHSLTSSICRSFQPISHGYISANALQ